MKTQLAWWKWLCIGLLVYTLLAGMLGPVPRLAILNETIRNTYFHVTMWFVMMFILGASVWHSVQYLRQSSPATDDRAAETAKVGVFFGLLGVVTGSLWAKFTWGDYWSNDPKQNGAAVALLIYLAYFVLRNSFEDEQQRGRVSAIYNVFAFATLIPLLYVLPRLTDSLHPGNGGNPAFSSYDMNSQVRLVFYPAIIGWTLLGAWLADLGIRLRAVRRHYQDAESDRALVNN